MEFDELNLQRNKNPIVIYNIPLLQPTAGEIADMGYDKYSDLLYTIISTSLDVADILWEEKQIWYEDIDEWEFFIQKASMNSKSIKIKTRNGTKVVEGLAISDEYRDAINFFLKSYGEYIVLDKKTGSSTETYFYNVKPTINTDEEIIYEIVNDNIKFTKAFYIYLTEYLKKVNWACFQYDFLKGGNKTAKKYILHHNYEIRKSRARKNIKPNITLSSIISSLVAKAQSYKEIWDYPIYMIYELYYRYIKFDDWYGTMDAIHSGNLNPESIDFEKLNWSSIVKNN